MIEYCNILATQRERGFAARLGNNEKEMIGITSWQRKKDCTTSEQCQPQTSPPFEVACFASP